MQSKLLPVAVAVAVAVATAACGASTPAVVEPPDAGLTDAAPRPCLDEWTVSEGTAGIGDNGRPFEILAPGRSLFWGNTQQRIVDACGIDVGRVGAESADQYYVDENGVFRAAYVLDSSLESWNGISLPVVRPEGSLVEYRPDGVPIGARAASYSDRWNTVYPWAGRLEASGAVGATGSTPRFQFVAADGSDSWALETPFIPNRKAGGTTGEWGFNESFAVVAMGAPEAPNTPTARVRVDAISRAGALLWQYFDVNFGTGSVLDMGAGGDVSLLEWALPGNGRTLVRLDSSGTERWRRPIADRDFAASGKFTVSTSPSGRTLVAATAYRGATLFGRRVPGPGGVDTNADGSALEGIVIGVNSDGTCAFVRVYDGVIHRTSAVGARFVSDDDVRILWDDALTPLRTPNGQGTRNLERVRWDTLVAKFGGTSL